MATKQIEAARAYEALMVPALFDEWAPRVLDAARVGSGDRVLDVACAASRASCRFVSTDGTVSFDSSALIVSGRKDGTEQEA